MMQADESDALMMPTGNRRQDNDGDSDGTGRYHHDWVDTIVEVARNCNKLFSKNTCGVCQIYVDKQLEFESRQEGKMNRNMIMTPGPESMVATASTFGPMSCGIGIGGTSNSLLEVELYRQFLFDEDSVVEGASLRGCEEYDDERAGAVEHTTSGQATGGMGPPSSQERDGEDDEVHTVTTQRTN